MLNASAPESTSRLHQIPESASYYKAAEIKPTDDVVVATLQTMTHAYGEQHPYLTDFLKSAEGRLCVVFDEAHHAPAPSYCKMLTAMRSDYAPILLIGLTATPTYSDPRKQGWLKELFPQGIIHQSTATALLADRILAQPIFEKVATEVSPDFDEREYQGGVETYRDIPEHIIKSLAENDDRNQAIANQYLAHQERYGRTIIFAERWYQCERIAAILNKNGIRANSVYSHVDASPATADFLSSTEPSEALMRLPKPPVAATEKADSSTKQGTLFPDD